MGQQHWLLNTTMAGFVFWAAFLWTVWAFAGQTPGCTLMTINSEVFAGMFWWGMPPDGALETLSRLAVIGAMFPFLGMVVRTISIAVWTWFHYGDEAGDGCGIFTTMCSSRPSGLRQAPRITYVRPWRKLRTTPSLCSTYCLRDQRY